MFTANDFHAAFIQLMHRVGRGEKVGSDLDDLIIRLEQTKRLHSETEWQQSVASVRGSLMTHFGSPLPRADVTVQVTNHPEMRRVYFVEAAMIRLAHLMDQST